MKLGVIARGEDRGLGIQTWEVCRALRPDRILIVDMGELARSWVSHVERFAGLGSVTVISHEEMSSPSKVGPWCAGLDVIYTAETFYGVGFPAIAAAEGAATVCHMNPEFYKHGHEPDWPKPTEWWLPSPWMIDDPRLTRDTHFVPMPVPDRWAPTVDRAGGPVRFLYVGGKPAAGDRNGLKQMFMALRLCSQPMEVTARLQQNWMPAPGDLPGVVRYLPRPGNIGNYWEMYAGYDVLVMPRRYGGLCLPAIEAAGAGLGLVMTDCDPNWYYPATLVEARVDEMFNVPIGEIALHDAIPRRLAETMDEIAADPYLLRHMKDRSIEWAEQTSWEALEPTWRGHLERAARKAK